MSEYEQRIIFSNNLRRIMAERDLKQVEVAEAIGVSPQTFNTWMSGKAIPRMGKVQLLADYFGIPKSFLMDEQNEIDAHDDLLTALERAFNDRPEMRTLFSIANKATAEDVEKTIKILETLKGE